MRYTDEWLTEHGYDGLYDAAAQGEDSCGCRVGDLYPCDADHREGRICRPGVTVTNDDGTTGIGKKMKPTKTMQAAIDFANRYNKKLEYSYDSWLWHGRLLGVFYVGKGFSSHTIDALVSAGLAEYTVRDASGRPIVMRLK